MFFSKLNVSSNISIFLDFLFNMTMSGLTPVTRTSGGIVPPLILCPGMSEYIVKCSGQDFSFLLLDSSGLNRVSM